MRPIKPTARTVARSATPGTRIPASAVIGYIGVCGALDLLLSAALAGLLAGGTGGAGTALVFGAFFVPVGVASVLSADRVLTTVARRRGR
ncbi:hypothetical protein GCM10009759_48070 [Kitasatospora saccharophila]|uniref:Uncharacterized protein n=1 Tax=Kitasatospora saccharophila TaxID=407973 RepID=A0ABN2XDC5_9ACTN